MSINSIQFNDPNYNSSKSTVQTTSSSNSSVTNSTVEDNMQIAEISDEDFVSDELKDEADKLQENHERIMEQLRQTIENIRQQKQSLINSLACAQNSEEIQSIRSDISGLNNKINEVYMLIVQELQDYDASLEELISGTESQQVENSDALRNIQASSSSAALQASYEGYNAEAGQKIAQSALTVDGTTGWCLRGVNKSLSRVYGISMSYASAYQAIPELQSDQGMGAHFKEISVSRDELSSLPPGAIVVWEPNEGNPHGHISIALGDGRESSDYIGTQMTSRNANYHVFIPIS